MAEGRGKQDSREYALTVEDGVCHSLSEEEATARHSSPSLCLVAPESFLPNSKWSSEASDITGSDFVLEVESESLAKSVAKESTSTSDLKRSSLAALDEAPCPSAAPSSSAQVSDAAPPSIREADIEGTRLVSAPLCVEKALSLKQKLIDQRMKELRAENRERELRRQRQQRLAHQQTQRRREEALAERRKRLQLACLWKERGMAAAAPPPRKEPRKARVSAETPGCPVNSRRGSSDELNAETSGACVSKPEEIWGRLLRERLLRSNSMRREDDDEGASCGDSAMSMRSNETFQFDEQGTTGVSASISVSSTQRPSKSKQLLTSRSSFLKTGRPNPGTRSNSLVSLRGGVTAQSSNVTSLAENDKSVSEGLHSPEAVDRTPATNRDEDAEKDALGILRQLLAERMRRRERRALRESALLGLPRHFRDASQSQPLPGLFAQRGIMNNIKARGGSLLYAPTPNFSSHADRWVEPTDSRPSLLCAKSSSSGVSKGERRKTLLHLKCGVFDPSKGETAKVAEGRDGTSRGKGSSRRVSRVSVTNRRLKTELLERLGTSSSSVSSCPVPFSFNATTPRRASTQKEETVLTRFGAETEALADAQSNGGESVPPNSKTLKQREPLTPNEVVAASSSPTNSQDKAWRDPSETRQSSSSTMSVSKKAEEKEDEGPVATASMLASQAGLKFIRVAPKRASLEELCDTRPTQPSTQAENQRRSEEARRTKTSASSRESTTLRKHLQRSDSRDEQVQAPVTRQTCNRSDNSLLSSLSLSVSQSSTTSKRAEPRVSRMEKPMRRDCASSVDTSSKTAARRGSSRSTNVPFLKASFAETESHQTQDPKLSDVLARLEAEAMLEENKLLLLDASQQALQSEAKSRRREESLLQQLSDILRVRQTSHASRQDAASHRGQSTRPCGKPPLPKVSSRSLSRRQRHAEDSPSEAERLLPLRRSSLSKERHQEDPPVPRFPSATSETRRSSEDASVSLKKLQKETRRVQRCFSKLPPLERGGTLQARDERRSRPPESNADSAPQREEDETFLLSLLREEEGPGGLSTARWILEALQALHASKNRLPRSVEDEACSSMKRKERQTADHSEVHDTDWRLSSSSRPHRRDSYSEIARNRRASSSMTSGLAVKTKISRAPRRDAQQTESLCV